MTPARLQAVRLLRMYGVSAYVECMARARLGTCLHRRHVRAQLRRRLADLPLHAHTQVLERRLRCGARLTAVAPEAPLSRHRAQDDVCCATGRSLLHGRE